jgi:starch synthase
VYFIEHDGYFDRPGLYSTDTGDYPDNAERFIFFCRAVLALLTRLNWFPHVLHCHDWQTALLPPYVRFLLGLDIRLYAAATIYTIHNLAYQGLFPAEIFPHMELPLPLFVPSGIEYYGQVNFMKAGLLYADYLTTVSPTYAEEICTPGFGAGLDGVLQSRSDLLVGVLNGADYDIWNPATDPALAAPYSAADLRGKAPCKTALLRAYALPEDLTTPLFGMVSRLVEQKGVDILAAALPQLMRLNLRLVLLGAGDPRYQEFFTAQAQAYPERLGVRLGFNDDLAHQIEAGCDAFLMPSRFEPCGLNQMYSLRYGTIPLVRATGGLRDTVSPFIAATGEGTGFVFHQPTAEAFMTAVRDALAVYADQPTWQRLIHNAMAQDLSWERSARHYVGLYQRAVAARARIVPRNDSNI